jgi:hypothetical protein
MVSCYVQLQLLPGVLIGLWTPRDGSDVVGTEAVVCRGADLIRRLAANSTSHLLCASFVQPSDRIANRTPLQLILTWPHLTNRKRGFCWPTSCALLGHVALSSLERLFLLFRCSHHTYDVQPFLDVLEEDVPNANAEDNSILVGTTLTYDYAIRLALLPS